MDFTLSDEQQALQDLARQIFADHGTNERHKELESAGADRDDPLWGALADSGLLGIALPEGHGGGGQSFMELAVVLTEQGRHTGRVPFLASAVMGGLTIAEFGTDAQQAAWLPGIADGSIVATAALVEPNRVPEDPALRAVADGDGWRLDGVKTCVPAGTQADLVLAPARCDDGEVRVFCLASSADGLTAARQETMIGIAQAELTFDGVRVEADDVLGSDGASVVRWVVDRAMAAMCATAVGVCEEAVRITAEYTKTRQQFDRPIASFQAVGQRAADAYIDTQAVRLTALQAAWRLGQGLPAEDAIVIAKFWVADGGQRVVHAAQHLHGGMGVDRDYPLHRYFLWAKQLELDLGGTHTQLLRLGAEIAASV
ncbi:MAG: acyl-CoA/acyl-ACP dehydrogenase [Acidimicrobiales bacterium]|nr:acyl-CoA/acyl-ACP dehydrogenase [Acidimicrobiales bacterium]